MLRTDYILPLLCFCAFCQAQTAGMALETALQTIQVVDSDHSANEAIQKAWRRVVESDAARIPEILAAMDGAGPLATNWLRAAVDTVVERELKGEGNLPLKALEAFLADRSHSPRPRRLAFEWIVQITPDRRQPLLEGMLDDSALELRYDAVESLIDQARVTGRGPLVRRLLQKALNASRDVEQIDRCAVALAKVGEPVDLVKHLGMITKWHAVGPFDNRGGKGFDVAYPPETEEVDLDAEYDGKLGRVAWLHISSDNAKGLVDLNALLAKHKGAIVYATTDFYADAAGHAQIRLSSYNATKVWLNGKQIDANEVYHTSMFLDQYISDVQLRQGRNVILLKVCQDEQTEPWTQSWQFQLRVTDKLGKAIQPSLEATKQ